MSYDRLDLEAVGGLVCTRRGRARVHALGVGHRVVMQRCAGFGSVAVAVMVAGWWVAVLVGGGRVAVLVGSAAAHL